MAVGTVYFPDFGRTFMLLLLYHIYSLVINMFMAVVQGGLPLYGCPVEATDLRAGAALMLAGLIAQGETRLLDEAGHIDRGYERRDDKLTLLGADITRE